RHRGLYRRGQVAGGAQRPPLHDEARDPRRPPLFTEPPDQPRQLTLRQLVGQLRGGDRIVRVHAHVEWALTAEAEAAGGVIELHGGDAEVEEHRVDLREAVAARDVVEVAE